MTHNQVAFKQALNQEAQNLEAARHNKEMERLTGEQNATTARYNELQAVNTARSIAETARHNRISEEISAGQLEAQRIYNEAQMAIANANLLLANRQQSTRESTLEETVRSNMAKESESLRHNQATESETHRTNTMNTLLGVGKIVAGLTQAVGVALLTKTAQKKRAGAQ